ncbi:MAG: RagB/SusD family nutrient uptake outer membrane protein, partial [Bacteroidota bacterium]
MKKYIQYIGLTLAVCLGFSCGDDFLDLSDPQEVTSEDFLLTVDDFEANMTGGYSLLQQADWYGRYMLLIPDVMGVDVKQNASANRGAAWAEFSGAPTTTQNENREFWKEIYEGIGNMNLMINADFTPIESREAEFNSIIGQAHAYRALAYFDLVRLFAQPYNFTGDAGHIGVPVITTFDTELLPERNTVAQVYDQIVEDFLVAIDMIPEGTGGANRITREAAQALLSRVYLYMEDYENAESLATEVIESGRYALVDSGNYANQFYPGGSSEAIFEIEFSLADNPGANHIGGMYKASGYGDYLPSQDLLDLLDPSDVRSTIFALDDGLDGSIYGSADGIGRRVNKYPSEGADNATDNVPVIRLSEMYLIRAEARVKKATPDGSGAQSDINFLRQKRWAAAADVTVTGADLITEILEERRRELCFEGHGVFDLNRNKLNLSRQDCTAPDDACFRTYPDDRFILAI